MITIAQRLRTFLASDYSHILISGFMLTYITIALLLSIVNTFITHRYDRAIGEIIFVFVMAGAYRHYRKTGNTLVASHFCFWPPGILIFAMLYLGHFNFFTVIYVILLPLAAFFLYDLKRGILYTVLNYAVLIVMIVHERSLVTDHFYLHSPTALTNTFFGSMYVIAFGLLYQLSFYRSYRQMKRANAEKEILLKEIHHRVKNNLNVIASIIDLQARRNDAKTTEQLQLTQGRIESIAIVHDMLYRRQEDFAQIGFEEYMRQLSHMVERLHVKRACVYEIEGNGIVLPVSVMLDLGLITNELLTNSHKHAFNQTEKPVIAISLMPVAPERYRYCYRDNGSGVADPSKIERSGSLGIKLVLLSAKKMDATVEIRNRDGLEIVIDFPYKEQGT